MTVFLWGVLVVICFIMMSSIVLFLSGGIFSMGVELKESRFSTELFYTLLIVYLIVMVGFGLIYFILSFRGIVLVEYGVSSDIGVIDSLANSIYFSGVTLLTIGYGDIVPVGIGRLVAIIEALIGFILPTAFVLKIVQFRGKD